MTTLTRTRGDTFSITIQYNRAGVPIDLTGAEIRFTLGREELAEEPSYNQDDPGVVIDRTNEATGEVRITVEYDLMQEFTAGNYPWDYEVTLLGERITLVVGRLILEEDVTK